MRQPLSILLPLHWMLVFGLFAALCTEQGFATLVTFLTGITANFGGISFEMTALFGVVFALNATLFLWLLLTMAFARRDAHSGGDIDDVAGMAFGLSILSMSSLLLVGFWLPGQMLVVGAVLTAALAASSASLAGERRAIAAVEAENRSDDLMQIAIRTRALGAAHSSLLPRVAGRFPKDGGAA
ncbi:MAG: hypothetical protein WBA44_04730 [Mesorhizobium sp.]